jgi:predicted transcriptional regulator
VKTLKDNVAEMIRELPADTSLEDIQYHLYVLEKLQRGQQAIRNGRGVTPEEARARLSKWIAD